jgi:hypothetical protein
VLVLNTPAAAGVLRGVGLWWEESGGGGFTLAGARWLVSPLRLTAMGSCPFSRSHFITVPQGLTRLDKGDHYWRVPYQTVAFHFVTTVQTLVTSAYMSELSIRRVWSVVTKWKTDLHHEPTLVRKLRLGFDIRSGPAVSRSLTSMSKSLLISSTDCRPSRCVTSTRLHVVLAAQPSDEGH